MAIDRRRNRARGAAAGGRGRELGGGRPQSWGLGASEPQRRQAGGVGAARGRGCEGAGGVEGKGAAGGSEGGGGRGGVRLGAGVASLHEAHGQAVGRVRARSGGGGGGGSRGRGRALPLSLSLSPSLPPSLRCSANRWALGRYWTPGCLDIPTAQHGGKRRYGCQGPDTYVEHSP